MASCFCVWKLVDDFDIHEDDWAIDDEGRAWVRIHSCKEESE